MLCVQHHAQHKKLSPNVPQTSWNLGDLVSVTHLVADGANAQTPTPAPTPVGVSSPQHMFSATILASAVENSTKGFALIFN